VLFLQPDRTDYLMGERFGSEEMLPDSGMRKSSCAIPPAAPLLGNCHRKIIVIIAFLTLLARLRPTGCAIPGDHPSDFLLETTLCIAETESSRNTD
jgi:hypothetical protein